MIERINKMKELMEKSLSETFGMEVEMKEVRNWALLEAAGEAYRIWQVTGLARSFLLISPKPGVENAPVLGIAKLIYAIRERTSEDVAYGATALSAVERKRLVARQVPFIVAGRQVFLPFLGISLRADAEAASRGMLGSASQAILLAWLTGVLTCPFRDRDAFRVAHCSRASVFRALAELADLGLVERRPKGIFFVGDVAKSCRFLLPRLKKSPVRDAILEALYG